MTSDYFEYKFYFIFTKMDFKKITNILDMTSDNKDLPKFLLKNGLMFMINQKEITMLMKKLELKLPC